MRACVRLIVATLKIHTDASFCQVRRGAHTEGNHVVARGDGAGVACHRNYAAIADGVHDAFLPLLDSVVGQLFRLPVNLDGSVGLSTQRLEHKISDRQGSDIAPGLGS